MKQDLEVEIKLYVRNLPQVEVRLIKLGAHLVQPRTHEINLRFDTPDGSLTRQARVVRLRQDTAARLTYKGPPSGVDGVRIRQEIEFTVSDFQAARRFLEAMGLVISIIYEKYRQVYQLGDLHVALDELPYGKFVEIEGPDSSTIRQACQQLELDFDKAVSESYTLLFEYLRRRINLEQRDLTFENFSGRSITPAELAVSPADAS